MVRKSLMMLLTSLAVFSGCATPQPQLTPVWQEYQTDPMVGKGFWIYVPSTYRHDRPAPLIVSCHGTPPYDVAEHHIKEWKFLAEQNGCIVIAPDLDATDGLFGDGPTGGMLRNEMVILSEISLLGYRYNIDLNNIMLTGFSGGGFPTYWVGLRNPGVFSFVVARNCNFSENNFDGWWPPEARQAKIMVYYGQNDPATIVVQSKNAIEYLQRNGFRVDTAVIPGAGHDRHPEVAMTFFRDNMRPPRASLPAGSAAQKPTATRTPAAPPAPSASRTPVAPAPASPGRRPTAGVP